MTPFRWQHVVRYLSLSIAGAALFISGSLVLVHAQQLQSQQLQLQQSQETRLAVDSIQIASLSQQVAEHQDKIEKLQVSLAVVKDVSEQNNKILWGVLIGTAMMLIERGVGFFSHRSEPDDE